MAGIAIVILLVALIRLFQVFLSSAFDSLYDWLDGAVVETDEEDLKDYMDNSEYDWGHNIKNYMEEEL